MNRTQSRRGPFVSDLIIQLSRSTGRIRDFSRWDIFFEAIQALNHVDQIHLRPARGFDDFVPIAQLRNGGEKAILERYAALNSRSEPVRIVERRVSRLSSGEISFLRFAAQASLYIENGTLILIDEPETHLHPNFISRFTALLDTLLERTGSAAIIATHSAYFVREVFREQVQVLRLTDDSVVHIERPRLRTFGGDVGAISFFVFNEDTHSILASRLQSFLTERGQTWEALYDEFKDELSLEFLSSLRAEME